MHRVARIPGPAFLALLVAAGSTIGGAVPAWLDDQVPSTTSHLQRSPDRRFPRTFDKLSSGMPIGTVDIERGVVVVRLDR